MATTTMDTPRDTKKNIYWAVAAVVAIIAAFAIFANGRRSIATDSSSTVPAASMSNTNRNSAMDAPASDTIQNPATIPGSFGNSNMNGVNGAAGGTADPTDTERLNRGTGSKNSDKRNEGRENRTDSNSTGTNSGQTTPDSRQIEGKIVDSI